MPGADRLPRGAVIVPELPLLGAAALPRLALGCFQPGGVGFEIILNGFGPCRRRRVVISGRGLRGRLVVVFGLVPPAVFGTPDCTLCRDGGGLKLPLAKLGWCEEAVALDQPRCAAATTRT